MAAKDKSIYEKFIIESADGTKNGDIKDVRIDQSLYLCSSAIVSSNL